MTLINALDNHWVTILGYAGGKGLETKLRQYGVFPGDRARVIRRAPLGGPILVEVDGREIVLGRGIADKILVEP